ncbi:MAG: aldehyde dehydrogenase [Capnocytophaga sp.]|nr:aldehyde dehydrogenase [Capnocytophaga sp.]
MDYTALVLSQRHFFLSGKTLSIDFRKEQLRKLKEAVSSNEKRLYDAVYKDFGKSKFDTYATELSLIYSEINYYLKKIKSLSRPRRVPTNLTNLPGMSRIHHEPYGCCLVIGAWNYPYQLSIVPAIAALAAGNTVIIKPSELASNTMRIMAEIINQTFDNQLFCVVEGGVEEASALLGNRFDKIFFTGSTRVGKIVYEAAAKHLTPVTLELGGKSPVIITPSADIEAAAKRIVWGKFLNGGQTCVAPDYALVHSSVKGKWLERVRSHMAKNGYSPKSDSYTRIINRNHFERIKALIDKDKVLFGGNVEEENLYIEPTVMDGVHWDDPVMQEEIFGPVLPVLEYTDFNEMLILLQQKEKPLAAYLFTSNSKEKQQFSERLSFGGGCINDVVMHLTNPHLPFGGVGNSGIGNYHGKHGFETFSHQKSVLQRATWGEPSLKYPPYSASKLEWIKRLLG